MRLPKDLEATSLLTLGMTGMLEGKPFKLTGRRCVQGQRGAIWNEWSLRFDHVRPPVFLAESGGTFTLFREGTLLPDLEELTPGELLPSKWGVIEIGLAMRLAQWGDLDEAAETYRYADFALQVGSGACATMSEGEVFVGESVDVLTLGLLPRAEPPSLIPAPDVARPSGLEVWLDVGDSGVLDGVRHQVLGAVARSQLELPDERWEEYVLYASGVGLRWLAVADGHWFYVSPSSASGSWKQLIAHAPPRSIRIDWAMGELPWSVDIGELSFLSEHESEARTVSAEWTSTDVSWSFSRPLLTDDVAKAFAKRSLPRPK